MRRAWNGRRLGVSVDAGKTSAVMAATYAVLVNSEPMGTCLSRSPLNLITRMMGFLQAWIAVQRAVTGF